MISKYDREENFPQNNKLKEMENQGTLNIMFEEGARHAPYSHTKQWKDTSKYEQDMKTNGGLYTPVYYYPLNVAFTGFHVEDGLLNSMNFVSSGEKLWTNIHPLLVPHLRTFL